MLLVLTNAYEAEYHAIEPPDPIEAIEIRMAELGIDRGGLGEFWASPADACRRS